ncbi:hypothetical protein FMEXI_13656 [Fusarium mexicanum]|uniref:Uncharacterized protein n=1 Tax=Fusarium mexicanum TaxID=751941 RepID=A0A8H5I6J6_9HYPO|nr:hypothetical protein FMEXI_13656 [Fusarium mexicanum]
MKEKALALDADVMPRLGKKRYFEIVKLLLRSHNMDEKPEEAVNKVRRTLTYPTSLINNDDMQQFLNSQSMLYGTFNSSALRTSARSRLSVFQACRDCGSSAARA